MESKLEKITDEVIKEEKIAIRKGKKIKKCCTDFQEILKICHHLYHSVRLLHISHQIFSYLLQYTKNYNF